MKFITLFFLLTFILLITAFSATYHYAAKHKYTSADTIIKLDSVKDKNLLRRNTNRRRGRDTVKLKKVTIVGDTTKKKKTDQLEAELVSTARDSIKGSNETEVGYYYGAARVTYVDFALDADYIRIDKKNHLVFASGLIDPKTHKYDGRPNFVQKGEAPVSADSILFNYVTKKAKLYNVVTNQDGDYLSGGQARSGKDGEVNYRNVLFSTCSLPYPDTHFGIVITKGIAEKHQIISGPAYLEIEGVPIPIVLPFGFFPKPDQKSSGVILPTFGEDQQLGFFLRGGGYYLSFSDYMDLTTTGTYYTKGSYDLNTVSRYLKKYKYQGSLSLSYGSHKYGLETDPPARDFNIAWTHSQDPAANPGTTFSASVNAGTSSFYQNTPAQTGYNLQALTQNNLRSSISYGKTWPGSPFNFTANLGHSQDITRKTVSLQLPTFSLNMTSLSPFASKDQTGDKKWYQNLTIGYSLQGTNNLSSVPESELFTANTFLKKFQNGFQQQIPISLSATIAKYFQFNSSISYTERDYFQTIRKHYARGSISGLDSLVTDTVQGFKRAGDYAISSGFSTKFYGMMQFTHGKIHKIRDVISPSFAFQYRPDFGDPKYGYYNTIVSNATVPYPYTTTTYSIFDQSVYGGPGRGKSAGISFSMDNEIEAKVRPSKTDTSQTDRTVPIIQGLSFSTFYNLLADSLKMSPINFSGHTSFFNQKVNVSFGGVFNPYVTQIRDSVASGRLIRYAHTIDRYTWQNGSFPTLTSFNASMSFSLNAAAFKKVNKQVPNQNTLQGANPAQADRLAMINSNPNAFVDFNIPWNVNLSYSFFYSNSGVNTSVGNTVNINGDLSVTPKWKVTFNTGVDLRAMSVSTSSVGIYRDLHCWDMSFQWIPFGFYKFYSVDIKVKASILQDLKLSKRRDYYNNY